MSSWVYRSSLTLLILALPSSGRAATSKRPSLLDDVSKVMPILACFDHTPLDNEPAKVTCAKLYGMSTKADIQDPRTLDDYRLLVVSFWTLLNRGPDREQRTALFPKAADYARCVEAAAYKEPGFSSRIASKVQTSRINAQLACRGRPLSMYGLDPMSTSLPPNAALLSFAKVLSNLAFNYALEVNGWFPDEMRPCLRYIGRPPSPGCAQEGRRRIQTRPAAPQTPYAQQPDLPK